ncbi:hypothetical protein [Lentilactobacillus farraginis]|uniref:Uncharacterized protein n=1 Tax=Lentilactobacillus farraginis DSM 18382 = JCM 14108 TaxID=1423743 RepID=X0PIL3_9LACO|nr:hypothetical protein [Lentilactobacillus farraginis]KRM09473.1 hypothetical protein FD41_GL002531 [Lentilactobacillus farraginis DSM 18382 = JCM 14108]GAF36396.1 hypothetical protein JCM14108_1362 [Lentilactobacillus farraginis DSM 18382 = JCM 14108]
MTDNTKGFDFEKQLKQLETGEIKKIVVQPEAFMAFQTAYMNYDKRKRIIGTAGQGGVITYIFEHDEQNQKS